MRTTNLVVAGKTVVVAGYGCAGKERYAGQRLGAKVIVTEVDPIKALKHHGRVPGHEDGGCCTLAIIL